MQRWWVVIIHGHLPPSLGNNLFRFIHSDTNKVNDSNKETASNQGISLKTMEDTRGINNGITDTLSARVEKKSRN